MRLAKLLCLLALLLPVSAALAQSGKIAGRVTDGGTGEPLPGVAVTIEGTTQGALTDVDGYYTILNVRPGTYSLKAAFIGYTPAIKENVRVNIDLTATVDFQLSEGTVGLGEVVVQAERPVVQRDVSASVANINQEQIENLPVSSVAEVIGLQAGFEPGLTVRGSGGSQVAFAVDGVTFADPRTNNPNTEISYTSIDEVQVQTGGFNAEYGNVRAGLINVVTKDPARDHYTADVILRYSGPSQKNFTGYGTDFGDPRYSFWAYPRLSHDTFPGDANGDGTTDPGEMCEVSLCGVKVLPEYLKKQYEQFSGWNDLANGDITAEQLRKGEEWTYRKDFTITQPDYEADGTITGPIPVIGPMLGNLRFSASFRQAQEAYVIPGQRDAEKRRTFQGKLVSDIGKGMKLALTGIHGLNEGVAFTGEGIGYRNVTAEMPGYTWDNRDYLESNLVGISVESEVFGDYFYSPHDHTNSVYGAEFTHTLSPKTFYEIHLQRSASSDLTGAPVHRILDPNDPTGVSQVMRCVTPDLQLREANSCEANEVALTQAPFGYNEKYEYYGSQAFGSQRGDARDTSDVSRWDARFDITSQLNRFMQVKAGAEYINSDYNIFYGSWDPANP
ncbi:MAG TPA: TonB-dependent receptor, partial [Rhodothermales bacterium]|nr:TonB-dependent receptor [Rhodothermales bacterium]